jgi:hypothetical protein
MRRSLLALAFVPLLSLAADPPTPAKDSRAAPKDPKGNPLAVGKDVPGPFHPYNVTGPRKGNFHCVISDHGMDPMVLLFVQDLRFSEPLKDLLRRLDNAVEKNPKLRLGCAAVFLTDDLKDVVGEDDKREEMAQQLADLGNDLKLKHVVLALDTKSDVEKYDLEREEAAYTLVLYRKFRILAGEALPRDKLTPEKVDEVMKLVADKLGATRK